VTRGRVPGRYLTPSPSTSADRSRRCSRRSS
jgi:hypothetical protein